MCFIVEYYSKANTVYNNVFTEKFQHYKVSTTSIIYRNMHRFWAPIIIATEVEIMKVSDES
jgi:hypothetical protein